MSLSEHDQGSLESLSIAELFESCIDKYSRLLIALGDEDCRAVKLKQVSIEKALDEYGRLKVWGEQTRATLPASTRGSLDDALRRDDGLKRNVAQILGHLIHQLGAALPFASKKIGDSIEIDIQSNSDLSSASDSEYSSMSSDESGVVTERPSGRHRTPKIAILMDHVQDQIGLLYHLESLLRRPRLSGRYLKSTGKSRKITPMEKYDYCHIEEKHRYWIESFNSDIELEDDKRYEDLLLQPPQERAYASWEDEPPVSHEELEARENTQEENESYTIISRLARANTRRREQLRYWERHPFSRNLEEVASVTNKESRLPLRGLDLTKGNDTERAKSLTSTPTVHSFSTVAKSAIDETQTHSGRPRTVYAASVVTGRQSARVPDIPKAALKDDQVECPFCHAMLASATIKTRMAWKRHVFRDLRPYICTYNDCTNPEKMYATRHDWIYHEMQMHRRQWRCQKCHVSFEKKASMASHLRTSHPESSLANQMPILLDISERPLDDGHRVDCALCLRQLPLSRLLEHIAQHMEEIALFVLPSLTEGDDDTNSNAVRMSRDQGNPDEPPRTPGSSLKFSEIDWTERPQQDARHFVSLIESQNPNIEGQSTAAEDDVTPGTTRLAQDKERARLSEIEVASKENELGNEHVETLRAKSRLVLAYDRIGQYEAAREVSIECVEGFKKVLGETEFETLESVQLLAFMQRRLDHFQEAEALLLEILEVRRETLGHQHTDTINTLANLSRVYIEQGRWNDAEEHLTKTLESMVHVLGELHRDTLEMTSELAMTYAEQGRLEEAEQLGNQNLELVKSNLPQESNVRYRVLENMARIYGAQGRKGEACGFLREALDWAITWIGVDSPWAITSSKNLALWENEV